MDNGARYAELEKLADLKERGVLSDQEFEEQKARVLNPPAKMSSQAGGFQRFVVAILWTMVFWIVGLFLVGAIAGGTHPADPAAAGRAAGAVLTIPMLFLALIGSAIGAITRKLPLTK